MPLNKTIDVTCRTWAKAFVEVMTDSYELSVSAEQNAGYALFTQDDLSRNVGIEFKRFCLLVNGSQNRVITFFRITAVALRIGPANLVVRGRGETAEVSLVHIFAEPTRTPEMFEIRLRVYAGHWADAVDPYVRWMEEEVWAALTRFLTAGVRRREAVKAVAEMADWPPQKVYQLALTDGVG